MDPEKENNDPFGNASAAIRKLFNDGVMGVAKGTRCQKASNLRYQYIQSLPGVKDALRANLDGTS